MENNTGNTNDWVEALTIAVEQRKNRESKIMGKIDKTFNEIVSVIKKDLEHINTYVYDEKVLDLQTNSPYQAIVLSDKSEFESIVAFIPEELSLCLLLPSSHKTYYPAFLNKWDGISFNNAPSELTLSDISRMLIEPIVKLEFHLK